MTNDPKQRRKRGKILIAMFGAIAALSASAALIPASAGALVKTETCRDVPTGSSSEIETECTNRYSPTPPDLTSGVSNASSEFGGGGGGRAGRKPLPPNPPDRPKGEDPQKEPDLVVKTECKGILENQLSMVDQWLEMDGLKGSGFTVSWGRALVAAWKKISKEPWKVTWGKRPMVEALEGFDSTWSHLQCDSLLSADEIRDVINRWIQFELDPRILRRSGLRLPGLRRR